MCQLGYDGPVTMGEDLMTIEIGHEQVSATQPEGPPN